MSTEFFQARLLFGGRIGTMVTRKGFSVKHPLIFWAVVVFVILPLAIAARIAADSVYIPWILGK